MDLLHYSGDNKRSEIISEEFFLSEDGRRSPEAELAATIEAYFAPTRDDPNGHPRCRYPARYLWINEKIDLPGYSVVPPFCDRLAQWARIDEIESVSLLLVSGYLGNPASAFGHSLLRFNTSDVREGRRFLDLTFNFGAVVPENEGTASYIVRGLFGGYVAGFSDSYYYTHDLTYTRTEFRDIWDYRLNLPQRQLNLLVLHLWEIVAKHYQYYFLTDNCSSRLAELLQLVIGESFDTEDRIAYLPVELFHRIHELDEQRGGSLIDSITYVPSRQRTMRWHFRDLGPELRHVANDVIENDGFEADQVADRVQEPEHAASVLDALLAYYEYRVEGERPDVSRAVKSARGNVVRARFQLPPSKSGGVEREERRSPAQGAAPMMLGGGGLWRDHGDGHGHLEWSPFHYDLMGFNGLEWSELVVLDTSLGIDAHGDAFIDRLDVIRVRNLNARATRIAGEDPWAWNVNFAFERASKSGGHTTRAFANGGTGLAQPIGRSMVGYVSLDGWVYSNPGNVAAGPNAGVIFQSDSWKWWIRGGVRIDEDTQEWREHATVEVSMKMSQHRSAHLALSHDGLGTTREDRTSLTLRQHF